MTLTVSISTKAEVELKAKAAAAGVDLETFAAQQLERLATVTRSVRELSGDAYEEFRASGMTDEQLGDLLEDAKHELRAEKRHPSR
jgi:hypothetical protein